MTKIKIFDQYESNKIVIASLVEEAVDFSIKKDEDKDFALGLKKRLQKKRKEIDELRKETTKPYREFVKKVNDAGSVILDQIADGESLIENKLLTYDRIREEERKKKAKAIDDAVTQVGTVISIAELEEFLSSLDIDDPRITLAVVERKKIIEEKIRQDEEKKRLEEEAKKIALANSELEKKEAIAKAQEEKIARDLEEIHRKEKEAKEMETLKEEAVLVDLVDRSVKQGSKVKGKRMYIKFEVIDESLVPITFKTVDEKKIRAALNSKLVTEIPGVKVREEAKII